MKNLALVILAAAAVACGGSNNPPASPSSTTASESKEGGGEHAHHKDGHDDHAGISPALKDFHHVLAPVWHSDPGATRTEKACSNVSAMKEKAAATSDSELQADVTALETACGTPDKKDAEAKLSTVHDRFHALAKEAKEKSEAK